MFFSLVVALAPVQSLRKTLHVNCRFSHNLKGYTDTMLYASCFICFSALLSRGKQNINSICRNSTNNLKKQENSLFSSGSYLGIVFSRVPFCPIYLAWLPFKGQNMFSVLLQPL